MHAFILAVVFSAIVGQPDLEAEELQKRLAHFVSVEKIQAALKIARELQPLLRPPVGRA